MRFDPRPTCPIAVAAATTAAAKPRISAVSPDPLAALFEPCSNAWVMSRPAGPGAMLCVVSVRTSVTVR